MAYSSYNIKTENDELSLKTNIRRNCIPNYGYKILRFQNASIINSKQ